MSVQSLDRHGRQVPQRVDGGTEEAAAKTSANRLGKEKEDAKTSIYKFAGIVNTLVFISRLLLLFVVVLFQFFSRLS